MVLLLTVAYIMIGLFASMWVATEVSKSRPDWTPWVWSVMHIMLAFFLAMLFTSLVTSVHPVSEWNAAVPMVTVCIPILLATAIMWFAIRRTGTSARRVVVQAAPGQTRNPAARTRAGQEALKRLEAERKRRIEQRDQGAAPGQRTRRGQPVRLPEDGARRPQTSAAQRRRQRPEGES